MAGRGPWVSSPGGGRLRGAWRAEVGGHWQEPSLLLDHSPTGWARAGGKAWACQRHGYGGAGCGRGVGQRDEVLAVSPDLPSALSATCPGTSPWLHSTLLA